MRFINFERTKLPEEILKHNLEEKRKYFSDICLEVEKSDAEVQVSVIEFNLYPCLAACMIAVMGVSVAVLGCLIRYSWLFAW